MQFQVPQFIDTEDKVVGPFSLRQFLYIGAGGLISAVFYFFVQTWLFIIAALVIMGVAVAIAFVKVNGRPFVKILSSAFDFYWKPQSYIWKPEAAAVPAAQKPVPQESGISLEAIASGMALHKSWENLQTGTPVTKTSDRQFVEKKMVERYQIFAKASGDRQAARRVDYR